MRPPTGLGERERALLDFERDWAAHAGRKGTAIRAAFGITPARYYQLLNRLLATPAALAYDPLTVKRLRRRHEERSRRRGKGALGERPGQ
ncbi:MAG TPA: DUF3263 domain-containing protein [Egibacteraceae bacterium]|jgi:hypothetical protein|nr:DUF3263 domain-containing protein [Egibacteraceae bacterium]